MTPPVVRPLLPRLRTGLSAGRLACLYAGFGLAKHVLPLPTLVGLAWTPTVDRPGPAAEARAIAVVTRVRRALGGNRDCLHGSLVLYRELLRAGAAPRLSIGMRKRGARLEGHSWVEVRGEVVGDRLADGEPWSVLAAFGPDGRLAPSGDCATR